MARGALALAAVLLLAPPAAAAQQPVPPAVESPAAVMSWLIGEWRGSGTMFGSSSKAVFIVSPVLGGRFLEFSYRAGGFEGRAFYGPTPGGGWRAQWFDNRGVTFPIVAHEIERTLTSDWGSPETEQGRTVYVLGQDGRLRITDSVRRGGAYRDFATHVLEKAD